MCVCLQKVAEQMEFSNPVSRVRTASACWAEQLGHHSSLYCQEQTAALGTGGPCLPMPIRVTAGTADGGGQLWAPGNMSTSAGPRESPLLVVSTAGVLGRAFPAGG